jgi:6-pyruvoyltetrahydropterin/6-carboxytetrahydropterin synthase
MYELRVKREFCAAHAIVMRGVRETTHGHNWRVTVSIVGAEVDDDGLLCDFHEVERVLDAILEPFQNADLNEVPAFDELNPTAEHVARHIAQGMSEALSDTVRVRSVGVTEATGCETLFYPAND